MGFKSLIEQQVQNAMTILGTDADGLATARTYIQVAEGVYNPATQTVVSGETRYESVPMVLVRFRIEDMDEEVRPQTDRVVLIASKDLAVVPDENDKVEDTDGSQYAFTRLLSDPADALHKIHVRLI